MPHRRRLLALAFSFAACTAVHAQQPAATPPKAGGNWASVKALPANTNVHITTDHGGKTCHIFAVSDDSLTCAKGKAAGAVIQRSEIQHIKLTHYGRSTLVGAGIGGGIGAVSGYVAGRNPPCTGFCLNIIGPGAVAAVAGVGGAVVGAAVGGPTDFTRGSSIYTRP